MVVSGSRLMGGVHPCPLMCLHCSSFDSLDWKRKMETEGKGNVEGRIVLSWSTVESVRSGGWVTGAAFGLPPQVSEGLGQALNGMIKMFGFQEGFTLSMVLLL